MKKIENDLFTIKKMKADFKAEKFEIFKLTGRIFKMKPFEGVYLEMDDVLIMRQVFKELSNDGRYGILIDGSNHFTGSPEMKEWTADKEHSSNRFATAFVTKKLANKLFGNFFMT